MRTKIQTEIIIHAPIDLVWSLLMQFDAYKNWNPFIYEIIGNAEKGQKIKVTLQDQQKSKMSFQATVLNKTVPQEFKWRGKLLMHGIFDGEHLFQLSTTADHHTKLIHSEEFSGILVRPFLKTLQTKTTVNFEQMNQALKQEAEKQFALT